MVYEDLLENQGTKNDGSDGEDSNPAQPVGGRSSI
jgi:hypothetical protein